MPYYTTDPRRDHDFDNHPYVYIYIFVLLYLCNCLLNRSTCARKSHLQVSWSLQGLPPFQKKLLAGMTSLHLASFRICICCVSSLCAWVPATTVVSFQIGCLQGEMTLSHETVGLCHVQACGNTCRYIYIYIFTYAFVFLEPMAANTLKT